MRQVAARAPRLSEASDSDMRALMDEAPKHGRSRAVVYGDTRPVTRAEFDAYKRSDKLHERVLIFVGAAFDLMVVILAVREFVV